MSLFEAEKLVFDAGSDGYRLSVSFVLEPGQCLWITGASGRGKSSLLRTLARLKSPVSGQMWFDRIPFEQMDAVDWRCRVAYLHQRATLFPGTVEHNLTLPFGLHARPSSHPDPAAVRTHLNRLKLPENIERRDALTLSVGELSRVALVRTLLIEPRVMLLDEGTAALDAAATEAVTAVLQEWLSANGRAIIGVTHDPLVRESLPGQEIDLEDPGLRAY